MDINEVFIAFENTFYQGERIGRICLGVYSSAELAHERCDELRQDMEHDYDPLFRRVFEVVPAELDMPMYEDDA